VEILKQLETAQELMGRGFGHNVEHRQVQCFLH